MPLIKDYYEPWTYNYEHLTTAKEGKHSPVAKAHSLISGDRLNLEWGPNWEDDLAGGHVTGPKIQIFKELKKISNSNLMKHL